MKANAGLAGEIFSGLAWTAWGKGARTVLQLVVLLILARLLTPEEFGVIGAAMIVIGLSEILANVGLGPALVQRPRLRRRHVSTAFSVSLILSALIGAAVWAGSPMIAAFFESRELEGVLKVLSLLFVIRGAAVTAESLARREMRFKWLANIETVSFAAGYLGAGIALGLLGYGVWALVVANLVVAAVKTGSMLWLFPPAGIAIRWRELRQLLYFGGGFSIARIANYAALNVDYLVVGRWLGVGALGLYGRAYQLMSVSATAFGQVLDEVLFPSMTKMQADQERLANAYFRGISLVALVMLPAGMFALALAPEVVAVALGSQWTEVTLPFQILVAGLMMRTSYKVSDSLARATGAVYRRAWRQAVYAALVFTGAAVGQMWGITGVAAGVLGAVTVNFLLMAHISLKLVGAGWGRFFAAHGPAFLVAAISLSVGYTAAEVLRSLDVPHIAVLAAAAAAVLVALLIALSLAPRAVLGVDGMWMFAFLKEYVRKFLKTRSGRHTAAGPLRAGTR